MRKLLIVILLLFFVARIDAQVRKIVLLEVFTNSGCGTCANSNEILQDFYSKYFGGVISVRYHPNFPDPRDPMYSGASEEIDDRVNYYNIMYTPQALFDGTSHGSPEDERELWNSMTERLALSSPVWLDINSQITEDSIKAIVKITGYGNLNEREMKLRVALLERMVTFEEPPGTNGETDFPDVFRKFLSGSEGVSIQQVTEGDSLSFSFSSSSDSSWVEHNLSVVAWIQSDVTKEIYQANSDIPTAIVESDESNVRTIETERFYEKRYRIINYADVEIPLAIDYKTNRFYDDWQYSLSYNGETFDSLETVLQPRDTLFISETLHSDKHASLLASFISVKNTSDTFPYKFRYNNLAYAESPDLIIVNTSGETPFESVILPVIKDSLGFDYAAVTSEETRYWLNEIHSAAFESAMLLTGNSSPAYENNDVKVVLNVLESGGTAFVSGQRILSSRGDFQSSRNLCDNYLDIQFVERSQEADIVGLEENEISAGMNFTLSGNYFPEPEVVISKNGNARPLFALASNNSKYVAMQNEGNGFKTIYTGFGIEEILDVDLRTQLFREIFAWFEVYPNSVYDEFAAPDHFYLAQNYPNPFNPVTTIKYSIPSAVASAPNDFGTRNNLSNSQRNRQIAVNVRLIVYDILGRKIATLVNENQLPGNYFVKFDASNLTSGVYFYMLRAGDFVRVKKMTLLK